MVVTAPCGHTFDDEHYDYTCYGDKGHYPIGTSPRTYCKKHDRYHPDCDKPQVVERIAEAS